MDRNSLIEVRNTWGIGDGSPLLVQETPDLDAIFTDPAPAPPQRLHESNRSYWERQTVEHVREALRAAYLSHPNPRVREVAIHTAPPSYGGVVAQMLVDLLADPVDAVRAAAADKISKHKLLHDFAIRALQDEIDQTGLLSTLGPAKAKQALELLDPHGRCG